MLIAQLFAKVPAVPALAPTQSEAPFLILQAVVPPALIALAIGATIKFRAQPILAA